MSEKEILFSAKLTVESNIMSKKTKRCLFLIKYQLIQIDNYYAFAKQKMNKLGGISEQNN